MLTAVATIAAACANGSTTSDARAQTPVRDAKARIPALPVISRGVPVFASSELYAARNAVDSSYASAWRGSIPGWIALDLSRVPAARRARVLVGWYNDPTTSPYDHTLVGEVAYNNLGDYTLEGNAARGGGDAPAGGWVRLVSVQGNRYHSRQHLVALKGFNWLRLSVTRGDGSPENEDASFNLDVHDASAGASDDWLFVGDSITQDGMHHRPVAGTPNFSQLVARRVRGHFPAFEDAGTYGLTSSDGARNIGAWLAGFPGRYVALAFGTNDAAACAPAARFAAAYAAMVQAVVAARKIPVVPTIPWARDAEVQRCAPALNARIRALYAKFPRIVKGPDLWSFFRGHTALISADGLHPSNAGYAAYRIRWASVMAANAYRAVR